MLCTGTVDCVCVYCVHTHDMSVPTCWPHLSLGPGVQPPTVRTSGTSVSQILTSFPANISFMINDDLTALEDMEIYTLTLIPSDPSIDIVQDTSQIIILDDDGKLHTYITGVITFIKHSVYIL